MPNLAAHRRLDRDILPQQPAPRHVPARRPALPEAVLTEVYRQYRPQVLRRCRRILRDEQQAEDATQTVFLKLWLYGHSFSEAQAPLGWLYRVAERCCFDQLRARVPSGDDSVARRRGATTAAPDPVEDRDLARRFLTRFDRRVGQIVVMRYCEERSMDDIADATRWSRQTVFKKLLFVHERAQALRGSLCGEQPNH